jgi:hypothetical protein
LTDFSFSLLSALVDNGRKPLEKLAFHRRLKPLVEAVRKFSFRTLKNSTVRAPTSHAVGLFLAGKFVVSPPRPCPFTKPAALTINHNHFPVWFWLVQDNP